VGTRASRRVRPGWRRRFDAIGVDIERLVTVEGGVDDPGTERTPVTAERLGRFVDAVIDGGAIGGSHYDYATTQAALWPILGRLNTL